jgi:hypothetical protein
MFCLRVFCLPRRCIAKLNVARLLHPDAVENPGDDLIYGVELARFLPVFPML